MAKYPAPRSTRTWQDMDLMSDILEPVGMDTSVLFPKCSPKVSTSTRSSETKSSSTHSSETKSSRRAENNKLDNSPDFNQNKTQQSSRQTNQRGMNSKYDYRSLHNRMDLSSPTEQSSYQYEDMQTSISSEEVYGRSLSSESSSSGRENHLRGMDRERNSLGGVGVIREASFSDRKIEKAGGREIISRSRSTRNKRNSKAADLPRQQQARVVGTNESHQKPNTLDSLHSPITSESREEDIPHGLRRANNESVQVREVRSYAAPDPHLNRLSKEISLGHRLKEIPGLSAEQEERIRRLIIGEGDPGGGVRSGVPVRETIFSSEICSYEYDEGQGPEPGDHGAASGTILFDDIGDINEDPKVTYDLIEGHLPPPQQGLTVLPGSQPSPQYSNKIRSSIDELLSQTPEASLHTDSFDIGSSGGYCGPEERREADSGVATDSGDRNDERVSVLSNVSASVSLDNLYLGEEADLADSDQSNRTIEALTITEYEGSPRRYGPRKPGSKQRSHVKSQYSSRHQPDTNKEGVDVTSRSHNSEDRKSKRPEPEQGGTVVPSESRSRPALVTSASVQSIVTSSQAHNTKSSSSVASSKSLSPQSTNSHSRTSRRIPGFPQRVVSSSSTDNVTVASSQHNTNNIANTQSDGSVNKHSNLSLQLLGQHSGSSSQDQDCSLLSFDETQPSAGQLPDQLIPTSDILQLGEEAAGNFQGDMAATSRASQMQSHQEQNNMNSYDYRYEFSETRKVLEEFFKAENEFPASSIPSASSPGAYHANESIYSAPQRPNHVSQAVPVEADLDYSLTRLESRQSGSSYVGSRLADAVEDIVPVISQKHVSPTLPRDAPHVPSSISGQSQFSRDLLDFVGGGHVDSIAPSVKSSQSRDQLSRGILTDTFPPPSRAVNIDPTSIISRIGTAEISVESGYDMLPPPPPPAYHDSRNFTLSPETTDCDSADLESELSVPSAGEGSYHSSGPRHTTMPILEDGLSSGHASDMDEENDSSHPSALTNHVTAVTAGQQQLPPNLSKRHNSSYIKQLEQLNMRNSGVQEHGRSNHVDRTADRQLQQDNSWTAGQLQQPDNMLANILAMESLSCRLPPPSPAPDNPDHGHHNAVTAAAAIKDIRKALQTTKTLSTIPVTPNSINSSNSMPLVNDPWLPRAGDIMEQPPPPMPPPPPVASSGPPSPACSTPPPPPPVELQDESDSEVEEERVPTPEIMKKDDEDLDTDQETDRLLGQQYSDTDNGYFDNAKSESSKKKSSKTKEGPVTDPKVLIEGVLFRARYLGSTQLVCEGQPTKATRMMQAEEAVSRIKAPEGESQPSTEVDLFISTEKIMVLNTDLKEIMMDHALRSISYIADIGDLVVIMARRRILPQDGEEAQVIGATPKMICHVFESEEAQFIAQSIGQAFQVAYMEFLKANGIEDHSFVKEMDYQEVLNSQEIYGDELQMFAKKELQKEVVVPKSKGEILGVVIVESGWGSMLPTIVLANLCPAGPAARCGHLNIGDQIIAINGVSLVGLPLSKCQEYIKNCKNKTAVKLTAVSCPPVVEVKIKRPDTKYQLGFSVQNGVICSLLRGGIAERGGVRVGHRIIEINGQSVVAVPHERIVNLLATSVGEIHMKTMPTSMYRLLTGQETPVYI